MIRMARWFCTSNLEYFYIKVKLVVQLAIREVGYYGQKVVYIKNLKVFQNSPLINLIHYWSIKLKSYIENLKNGICAKVHGRHGNWGNCIVPDYHR